MNRRSDAFAVAGPLLGGDEVRARAARAREINGWRFQHTLAKLARRVLAGVVLLVALGLWCGVTWSGLVQFGRVALTLAVVLTIGAAVLAVARAGSMVGGQVHAIHLHPGHGTKTAAVHEGGHAAVCRAVGGTVGSVHIFPDGSGVTWVKLPRDATVVDDVAVTVAGEVAAGTRAGCASDQKYVRQLLATLPASERAAAKRAGYALARGVVKGWWGDGGVSVTARKLLRDGHA